MEIAAIDANTKMQETQRKMSSHFTFLNGHNLIICKLSEVSNVFIKGLCQKQF